MANRHTEPMGAQTLPDAQQAYHLQFHFAVVGLRIDHYRRLRFAHAGKENGQKGKRIATGTIPFRRYVKKTSLYVETLRGSRVYIYLMYLYGLLLIGENFIPCNFRKYVSM